MKPNRTDALKAVINQIREVMPFEDLEATICTGQCNQCSVKLLEYLDTLIEEWEFRLKQGDIPSFGEIAQLAKTSKKIYKILEKNNLVD
ncbi:MAG: hypothetical protein HQL46_02670 [Gammaproteobacteria bacterium]|nr:hypothetical protein [Gammaproteobacteria bacterium]